jgi:hypothetical protein
VRATWMTLPAGRLKNVLHHPQAGAVGSDTELLAPAVGGRGRAALG